MIEVYYVDISTKSTGNRYKFVIVLDRESHDSPNLIGNGFYGLEANKFDRVVAAQENKIRFARHYDFAIIYSQLTPANKRRNADDY
jgi:hypothetical protein